MLLLVFAICTPAFTIMVPISIFGIASDMLSLWLIFSNLFFFYYCILKLFSVMSISTCFV